MIDSARERIARWPLTLLRIYAGLVLVLAARNLPLPGLEIVTGIALVVGFATPVAAIVALVLVGSNLLPIHGLSILISPGPRTAFAMLLVTITLGRAGRAFGFDAELAKRYPRIPLW